MESGADPARQGHSVPFNRTAVLADQLVRQVVDGGPNDSVVLSEEPELGHLRRAALPEQDPGIIQTAVVNGNLEPARQAGDGRGASRG
jgi:hypothetical protein